MTRQDFDLRDFLPYLLNQAAETSSLDFQQIYKDRYGMLRTEWRVLFHLGMFGRMTASGIGQAAKTHKTKISRAVQRLVERRFVARFPDENDRRVEHLELTLKGQAAYDDLRQVAQDYDTALAANLTKDEIGILRAALKKLSQTDASGFT